jgi:hypothetical protein
MKKALVLGVALMTLVAFSGMASGTWVLKYRLNASYKMQSLGYYGPYEVTARAHEVDNAMWIDQGQFKAAQVDTETWHVSYLIKVLDGNKPVSMTHYKLWYRMHYVYNNPNNQNAGAGYYQWFCKTSIGVCFVLTNWPYAEEAPLTPVETLFLPVGENMYVYTLQ